ncbi:MAG: MBL fold metallo-hydrolase [Terriglobia bacterium]
MPAPNWTVDVLLEGNWRGASSVLLTGAAGRILVDSGMPHDAHQLLGALSARGLRPEDIRWIINTHFHIDHVSNNCLFPSSIIYASEQSHDWCRRLYDDFLHSASWQSSVLTYYPEVYEYENAAELVAKMRKIAARWWSSERIGAPAQFRWIERHPLPEGLETVTTSGHVPGHISLILPNGGDATVIAGDALVTRTHDDQVLTMIPCCRAEYLRDRERILSFPGTIIPGHERRFENPGT